MSVRILLSLTVVACLAANSVVRGQDASKPNLVVILADDLGYSDLGCYGGEIQTPNLDALAAGGLRFTQFYNTARCWPSRSALMTGYYAQQIRRDDLPRLGGGNRGTRPQWARLLPDFLAPLGYRSYHSGKWHIDGPVLAGGFDRSYLINDQNRFFNPQQHSLDDTPLARVPPGTNFYATTAIADRAVGFLKEHQQQHGVEPFFLYLCFTAPHFPIHARADDIAKYDGVYDVGWDAIRDRRAAKQRELGLLSAALSPLDAETIPAWNFAEADLKAKIGDVEVCHAVPWKTLTPDQQTFQAQKMAVHAAMVDRMDQEIGRVLEQVRAMQVDQNTITMFLSDNGASAEQIIRGDGHDPNAPVGSAATYLGIGPGWSTAANTPFRLHKSWVHEGGIATPFIVHWPQGLPQRGEVRSNPGHIIDVVPTLLEFVGAQKPQDWEGTPIPPAPGRSLVPAIAKDGTAPHDYFWWYHSSNRAIRIGDWKLVSQGADGPWELFDLSHDRTELSDLSTSHPTKAEELKAAWTQRMEEFRALASQDVPPAGPPSNRPARRPNRQQPATN